MSRTSLLAGLVGALAVAAVPRASAAGPCPVLPQMPGHEAGLVAPSPPQPQVHPPYVSELEVQRRCNVWLSSFRPAVDFALPGRAGSVVVARRLWPRGRVRPLVLDPSSLATPVLWDPAPHDKR